MTTKLAIRVNLLVALGFVIAPHFDIVKDTLGVETASDNFAWLVTVGSLLYAFTSTALLASVSHEREELGKMRSEISQHFSSPRIRLLRDDEFYADFLNAIRNATSHVLICYFGPTRPDASRRQERNRYYRDVSEAAGHQARVQFRRLVRDTESNRQWVCESLDRWLGLPNMSVTLLEDLPANDDMPLALSVQIVDDHVAWLVAVEGHERIGQYRDIYVEDATFASFLTKYFERLWNHGMIIVDSGQLTAEGETICGNEGTPDR